MLETFSGRRASQEEFELRSLVELLVTRGVRNYCEIGSREGDTFHEIMKSMPSGSRGLACDLPGGLWGKVTTKRKLERAITDLQRRGYKAQTLFGNSAEQSVIDAITKAGPFDAVFIDGDHTYDGVRADWLNYRGLAPLVIFHDIVGDGQYEKVYGRPVQVHLLWEEIKAEGYRTQEFIAAGSRMGIGVVFTDQPLDTHATF